MKNLITSMACIAILLAFVIQFAQNQVLYNHIIATDQAINNFKEVVKQEGCITEGNRQKLKEEIKESVNCSYDEIKVYGTNVPMERGERIHYIVIVPIKNIIGASNFWGIKGKDNQINYRTDRYTTSECLRR